MRYRIPIARTLVAMTIAIATPFFGCGTSTETITAALYESCGIIDGIDVECSDSSGICISSPYTNNPNSFCSDECFTPTHTDTRVGACEQSMDCDGGCCLINVVVDSTGDGTYGKGHCVPFAPE